MTNCEHRTNSNIQVGGSQLKAVLGSPVSAVASTEGQLCYILLEENPLEPSCPLPKCGTDDCPVALWKQGNKEYELALVEFREMIKSGKFA